MFKNFLQHPVIGFLELTDEVLNLFSREELEKLAENCFTSKTKNYDLLAKLTKKLCAGQLCPLFHAISILEADAVEIMLDNYRQEALYGLKTYRMNDALSKLWQQIHSAKHGDMNVVEKRKNIVMIEPLAKLKSNV
jgi:hypothetical protein